MPAKPLSERRNRHPRRARAQPARRHRPHAARQPRVHHGAVRIGQVVARLRHALRRGAAPLRRVALGLRAPVPGADGQARRRLHRGPLAGDLDRPEDDLAQPALDGRHRHRGARLPAPAVRAHRAAALSRSAGGRSPASRPSRSSTRCWRCPRARASRSTRRSCAAARASTATCSRACAARASRACASTARRTCSTRCRRSTRSSSTTSRSVVDRLVIKDDLRQRLTDSIETALRLGDGLVEVREVDGPVHTYSEKFACPEHGVSLAELAPRDVLVQLAARRLPGLHRPRRDARGRPRAGRARSRALDPRRCARALERLRLELLRAGARGDRRSLGGAARPAVGRALRASIRTCT